MKFIFSILFTTCFTHYCLSQNLKYYLDTKDQITDSTHAVSYMIVFEKTQKDTLFRMKQFSLENLLIIEGAFKDEALSIPHGEYIYYTIIRESSNGSFSKANNYKDTTYHKPIAHFIDARGKFVNGKMNGEWLHYFKNESIKRVETFENDILNGSYKEFWENGQLMLSGNYKNGIKNGIWLQDGGLYEVTFVDGKSVNKKLNKVVQSQQLKEKKELQLKIKEVSKYDVAARPKGNFRYDLREFLILQNFNAIANEEAKVSFIVKEDGKLSEPTVTGLSDMTLMVKIKEFFAKAQLWYPGTTGIDKKPTVNYIQYRLRYL
jgi:antitoxin component YwqK of YwqJK toxin-antitoxin module